MTTPNHDWHLDSPESDTIVCSRCAAATYDPAAYFEPCIEDSRPFAEVTARSVVIHLPKQCQVDRVAVDREDLATWVRSDFLGWARAMVARTTGFFDEDLAQEVVRVLKRAMQDI